MNQGFPCLLPPFATPEVVARGSSSSVERSLSMVFQSTLARGTGFDSLVLQRFIFRCASSQNRIINKDRKPMAQSNNGSNVARYRNPSRGSDGGGDLQPQAVPGIAQSDPSSA
ncbi:hypothetical protein PCASD_00857 [Puccinia coronata f. sp. avenae]|uniref:Uncharacterized protein n=1 Tax=Puccinia coronata f. sp. avenae TaxID=200324 RepID=A0A2N5VPL2_9BASI|nr:hypothetical protein PCASD_00857 [Puccinia coronata f. sp. avenae]